MLYDNQFNEISSVFRCAYIATRLDHTAFHKTRFPIWKFCDRACEKCHRDKVKRENMIKT